MSDYADEAAKAIREHLGLSPYLCPEIQIADIIRRHAPPQPECQHDPKNVVADVLEANQAPSRKRGQQSDVV